MPTGCALMEAVVEGQVRSTSLEDRLEGGGERHGERAYVSQSTLRGLLLSPEPPLCRFRIGAVRDFPPRPPRRPAAAEPDALRLSPGAPSPGGVRHALGQRAGRAARLALPGRSLTDKVPGMFWPLIGGFIAV